jgi:spermidine/putrescine transport system ATP-binding protein
VEATVLAAGDASVLLATEALGQVSAPASSSALAGQQGWLALRPEQIRIGHPGTLADLPNQVSGIVCDFLYVGDVTTYIVELAGGFRIEALLTNSAPGQARFFEQGESVQVAWPSDVGRYLHE